MSETTFDQWALVEVMGHSRYAGRVTEQAIGGASFVRVDVPEMDGRPAFCKLLGAASIFAITPCTEESARAAAKSIQAIPFVQFDAPRLPAPVGRPVQDDDDYGYCDENI